MRILIVTLLGVFTSISTIAQTNTQRLIELGKLYNDFMFRNDPTKDHLKPLKSNVPDNFKTTTSFIIQTLTRNNKLLTKDYLSRPDDETLMQIYIIRAINSNVMAEDPIDNNKLADSLQAAKIPVYELIDNYYDMVFTAVGNKNQPFNLSKVDLKINDYNLKDDTEKGIVFLQCMHLCGTTIWGYMNIPKPPNTKKAFENIKLFPRINGLPYYQFNDFQFTDFDMVIVKDQGSQSYKSYYLNKYYETLLFHLISLNKEGGSEKEKNDLMLGSILKQRNLYKYTKYKETLENIFKEQKQE